MENNKIPTAEEYVNNHPYICAFLSSAQGFEILTSFMKDFAKIHVEAALKEASQKAIIVNHIPTKEDDRVYKKVDIDSILNSYPLSNIK